MTGRLDELLVFPRWVIGIELEQAWGRLSACACKSIEQAEEILKVEELSLPEFRRQFLSHSSSFCECRNSRVTFKVGGAASDQSQFEGRKARQKYEKMGSVRLGRFSPSRIDLPSQGS